TLDFGPNNQVVGNASFTGGTTTGTGSLLANDYNVNGGTIAVSLAGNNVFLTKNGAASAALTATNTYTGQTTVNSGNLSVSFLNDFGTPSGIGNPPTNIVEDLKLNGGTFTYIGATATSTNRLFQLNGQA